MSSWENKQITNHHLIVSNNNIRPLYMHLSHTQTCEEWVEQSLILSSSTLPSSFCYVIFTKSYHLYFLKSRFVVFYQAINLRILIHFGVVTRIVLTAYCYDNIKKCPAPIKLKVVKCWPNNHLYSSNLNH